MTIDPIASLEHDHVHLSRLVADARRLLGSDPIDQEQVVSALTALRDDLFEHFGREEEALFPYLRATLPDLSAALAELEAAHDRICGGVSRLLGALSSEAHRALAPSLFARFDGEYGEHARREAELLRGLGPRLDASQRAQVALLLRE